jgi:hypothetical protein
MGQEQLQQMLEKLGSVGVLMPALTLAAGLLLWLLGRKLARPACAFSGLVLGGIMGLVIGEAMVDQGGVMLAMVIGAAIAGALLAALLFRVWMALSGAVIFGLAASAAVLLWQQAPVDDPADTPHTADTTQTQTGDDAGGTGGTGGEITLDIPVDALTDPIREGIAAVMDGEDPADPATVDSEVAAKIGTAILDALRGLAGYYRESLGAWWSQAGAGVRGGVMIAGLIAAVGGLLIGLIGPYLAASLQSAAAGSVLMLFSSFSLLAQLMPEHLGWLPASPRGVLVCLGLITAAGLALQWTIFARKTDK